MFRNRFISLTVFFILCAFYSKVTFAQNQKIGYIESDVIMQQMPEYSGIEQQLQVLSDNWQSEINDMENELEELQREFEAREILFTDEVREQRLAEIERKNSELEQFIESKFGPSGDYFTQQKEFLEPIQRTILDALYRVSEREDFDFVFDKSEDVRFLFVKQEWNLTEDVLLEIGIEETTN